MGERMLRLGLHRGGKRQQLGFAEGGDGLDGDQRRLALGQRTGLVDDQRIDLFKCLQGFGILHQHASPGTPAGADHDRHGRGEPERARAGDDQDGDRVQQRVAHARRRADQ